MKNQDSKKKRNVTKVIISGLLIVSLLAITGCGSDGNIKSTNSIVDDFITDVSIEKTVIAENNNYKITADSLEVDEYEAVIKFTLENKSSNKLEFISGSVGYSCNSVNNVMYQGGYVDCEVEAGAEATEEMSINVNELLLDGIKGISQLEVGFEISDEDYNSQYTGPKTIKTSIADTYDMSKDKFASSFEETAKDIRDDISVSYVSDKTVYDSRGISINAVAIAKNADGETSAILEIKNSTKNQVYLQTGEISANGIKLYDGENWSYDAVNAGKCIFLTLELDKMLSDDDETLEDKGITTLDEIKFNLSIYKQDYNKVAGPNTVKIPLD